MDHNLPQRICNKPSVNKSIRAIQRPLYDTNLGYSEMSLGLWVVEDLDLIDITKDLTHVEQKALIYVIVQITERQLLWQDGRHIMLVIL